MSDIPENNSQEQDTPDKSLPVKDPSENGIESIISEFEDVQPIIDKLDPKDKRVVVKAMVALSVKRSWSGPLPPPDILKGYNECFDGGAKAIFDLTKNQSDHRMGMEKTVITEELKQSNTGQIFGFIIALAFLIASVVLIWNGHETAGTVIGTVDLCSLVAIFVLGKYGMKKQMDDKPQSLKQIDDDDDE